jgi:methyl-accepting chemotaxis protein
VTSKDERDNLYTRAYGPTTAAVYASSLAKDLALQGATYNLALARNGGDAAAAQKDPLAKDVLPAIQKDQKALKSVRPQLAQAPAEMQSLAKRIVDASTTYTETLNTILKLEPDAPENVELGKKLDVTVKELDTAAMAFAGKSDAYAKQSAADIGTAYTSSRTLILIALGFAVVLGLAIALLISAQINGVVRKIRDRLTSLRENDTASLREGLGAIAGGDLTKRAHAVTERIGATTNDEIGDIAGMIDEVTADTATSIQAYNESLDSLNVLIGRVGRSAETLSAASEEMAATSEETGRAVAEIAQAIGEVAHGAERQATAVGGARRLTDEMADATRSSAAGQIGGIVDTITTIAEQITLLALNAAIEAARAGEHGRGFAVVADEVRKLAEESQQAAASISSLIAEIQTETNRAVEVVELGADRTTEGTTTVEEARAAFEAINAHVQEMGDRVTHIAAATQQLTTTSAQMGEEVASVAVVAEQTSATVEEVSASTQQTSASAQQIAASAQTLAATAVELRELVGAFAIAGAEDRD